MAKGRFRRAAPRVRYLTRKAGGGLRRAGGAVAKRAAAEKHTLAAVAAGGALGYAERKGIKLPKIGPLSTAASAGAIAWALGKYMKSNVASHVATGCLSVAAFQYMRDQGSGVSGDDSDAAQSYLEGSLEGDELEGDDEQG